MGSTTLPERSCRRKTVARTNPRSSRVFRSGCHEIGVPFSDLIRFGGSRGPVAGSDRLERRSGCPSATRWSVVEHHPRTRLSVSIHIFVNDTQLSENDFFFVGRLEPAACRMRIANPHYTGATTE